MEKTVEKPEDLGHEETAKLVLDMFHRIMIHHALWFTEVRHQMGGDKAFETLQAASKTSFAIQMKRLSKVLGFEMKDGVPAPLLDMPKEKLTGLLDSVAINWLANDGVWFQTVENTHGMNDAKRVNDSCWAHFSPFEAMSVKGILGLPENPGLSGLKRALSFRLYARINEQDFVDEDENSFTFRMVDCRVQSARKRKGLADYPCKSAGCVEYPYFARAIDSRIRTECVGCPPDEHPEEWFCAWRFILDEA